MKVAEIVAEELVLNIFVQAIDEATVLAAAVDTDTKQRKQEEEPMEIVITPPIDEDLKATKPPESIQQQPKEEMELDMEKVQHRAAPGGQFSFHSWFVFDVTTFFGVWYRYCRCLFISYLLLN